MKIKRLAVNHFGKLKGLTLSFGDGINLISGGNESGKSTLHSFLNAMFFGMERSRGRAALNDDYTRFLPWDGGTYSGVVEIEKDKELFSVSRNFQKDAHPLIITNETRAADVPATNENMKALLCDLSPAICRNTISIGQLSTGTGHELADELRNHIINLKTAGNVQVNTNAALSDLRIRKKRLENSFSKPAKREAEEFVLRIRSMESDLSSGPPLPQLSKIEEQKQTLENSVNELNARTDRLSDEISESEAALRNHMFASPDDVLEIKDDVDYYDERAAAYIRKHSGGYSGGKRFIYLALTILSLLGLLACSWFGYYNFVKPDLTLAFSFCGGALLCLIISVILITLQYKGSDFKYSCGMLSELYSDEFGSYPDFIGPKEVSDLRERLDHYHSLFDTINNDKSQLAATRDQLAKTREQLDNTRHMYDNARQVYWQYEQKELALRMLHERYSGLSDQLEKNEAITKDIEAIDLAIETIQKLSDDVFESFGLFLEETSSDLIRSITGGAYSGISIDDSFNITLEHHGIQVPINRVSTGTLDQVYLAVRLACVEFLWPDETMPLLFDDTFAMYDRVRLRETLRWLSENYAGQIFIFTCHSREEELLKELHVPYTGMSFT